MDARRQHSPLQQLESEGIHSRGLNEDDMGKNSLEWLSHPNFPRILDSPGLTIASSVVIYPRKWFSGW